MTADTLKRCHCGDPLNAKGLCDHCDTSPLEPIKHDAKTGCVRCRTLDKWGTVPGTFEDLPGGWQDNRPRR